MNNELGNQFWNHHSLEELAEEQQVKPIYDVTVLYGIWPGEVNDGFELEIEKLRHSVRGTTTE